MNRNFMIASGSIGAVAVGLIIWFLVPSGPDWDLHIVFFSVGQADAIVVLDSEGNTCIIDAGPGSTAAGQITTFLSDADQNGVGDITNVKLGFCTHYDQDHMGGFSSLVSSGINFSTVYDQGPSQKRQGAARYTEYLAAVGDPNNDMEDNDTQASNPFVRKKARVGLHWTLGEATIRCVSARGDTRGSTHDLDWDPSNRDIDENPGSIALLITLGDFEFYTAGDQTSDDWSGAANEDTEIAVVNSGVLGTENDIDVLKVNHHGADTSTGDAFVNALDPEVAIISTEWRTNHTNPERITVKQLVENQAVVYITGNGLDPSGRFSDSNKTNEDDAFTVPADSFINNAGDIHIFVKAGGRVYTVVVADGSFRDFSAVDSDNVRP